MLENMTVEKSTFITLTYADEALPIVITSDMCAMGTLMPDHLQRWLKRLRKRVDTEKLRYFAVGEYGEGRGRPHYHVAVFGVEGCIYGDSRLSPFELCKCDSCVLLRRTWDCGFVHQGTIELKSMQYLCSYMLKGMYRKDDPRLRGRAPEFRRMSLRPGIGAAAMRFVAERLRVDGMAEERVTPATLRFGKRILPFGKYLRGKLREELGRDKKASAEEIEVAKERMRPLYEIAARLTENTVSKTVSDKLLYRLLVEANRERARQLEAREKVFNKGYRK